MRIELASGTPAELARPAGGGSRGLVVATDIMGLRPLFEELCARLAAQEGWVVCAPEPFPGRQALSVEERLAAMDGLDDARQLGDLSAAADATGCQRVGVLGFCMGGMYALKAAGSGRFDRAVSFYGPIRVPADWRGPGQGEPLDALAGAGRAPVLALVGGRDPYTPPEDVEALRRLEGVSVVVYPEAEHGFVHDESRPAHRPDDAADAWGRARRFLA
jgi:dienelactone hydrolase